MLHITNGDSVADKLTQSMKTRGKVIPWQDILFEGPVPIYQSLAALSKVRAKYLSSHHYGQYSEILTQFQQRDGIVEDYRHWGEITLWFEHDVSDQLQLLQILAWFYDKDCQDINVICINQHPNHADFYGLGQLSLVELEDLLSTRQVVTFAQLRLAHRIWHAFSADDPVLLQSFLDEDLSLFPYLKQALWRFFEEYPALDNGLTKTQRYIVDAVADGAADLLTIFEQFKRDEGKRFLGMGDWGFINVVSQLTHADQPLLAISDDSDVVAPRQGVEVFAKITLHLTETGEKVQRGRLDWLKICDHDCWRGGVHLSGYHCWRWDMQRQQLCYP